MNSEPASDRAPGPVLIVDDEEDIVTYLLEVLRDHGIEAAGATTPHDAREEIERRPPGLVLLDIMMPGTSGVSLYRWIREESSAPSVPVLFISGYSKIEDFEGRGIDVLQGVALGPRDGFLEKPIRRESLLERVRNLVGPSAGGHR